MIPQLPGTLFTVVLGPAPVLRGRVLDAATHAPLARAYVDAVSGRRRLWTRSEPDGSFAIRPAPAGDWSVGAVAPRYVQTTRRLARARNSDKPVELLLKEGVTISGRVTDDERRPVAAARIRVSENSRAGPTAAALTAEDGTFTLRRIPAVETLRLVATHPDFEPASLGDLGLKPGEKRTGVAFALTRGAIVAGIVTAGGAPLAGAQVSLAFGRRGAGVEAPPRSLTGPVWSWPSATTGADGRFRIGGLAPGEYTVTASKIGYARESTDGIVVAGRRGPQQLVFALGPEAVIAGSARGKRGSGVADQFVRATAADASIRSGGFAQTLADGSFRIDGLKPGVTYTLTVSSGMASGQRKSVIAPAEGVELSGIGIGRIEGRVLDAGGRPVTEFQVTAQNDRSSSGANRVNPVRQDVSSESGEFALENVPATLLEVRVVAKEYQPARIGGIALEEGETRSGVELTLSRGVSLQGRVLDARSGAPLPDIDVRADGAPSGATTDADGSFEIGGLPPGKVRVTASGSDYTPASQVVEAGENAAPVELKLSAGASVAAIVVSPGGEPQAGAQAVLTQAGQNSYNGTKATAGPDGRLLFSHLAPGRYTLTAGIAGRYAKPVDLTLEADQTRDGVRVVIGGGATVLVTVTGLSPEERSQVSVFLSTNASNGSTRELPDGRFEALDVAPGPTGVYARVGLSMDPTGKSVSRSVTVPEEGTIEVELPFEAGFTLTVHVQRDGQPVEGAWVNARPALPENGTFGSAATDASGSCRLTGLKAGSFHVFVYSMATSSAAPEQKVDVNGDQTLEFTLPAGRLAGRVVASGSSQPLADVQITVSPTNTGGSFMSHSATTDSAGQFQFSGLDAGPLSLTAQKKSYLVETRTVSPDAAEDFVIEMTRGDGLDVTARDGILGTPLGSFSAQVFDGAGTALTAAYVQLDSTGRGEIPSLKPGSYSILASANGYAPSAYDGVTVPGSGLTVILTPGGTLDVDVQADRLAAGPIACQMTARGLPLAYRQWGKRGDLSLARASTHLTNFPPVAGVLACPGTAPVAFTVPEGGSTRIAVK
ncbi:MAG TPA: carboxypeptidase regulatory-like domain-containing protein [Thermoanaerobaculia bacterium]|nr:carboxypeptidase regulatory-like domain-containing protein [Thermoanaerobaculia bacterium]